MQGNNSSGIFRSDSVFSPIPKTDKSTYANGLVINESPKLHNSTRLGRLSRYSLSEDMRLSNVSSSKMKPVDKSPQLRSRAAGIKTTQTVAGPLLASTRHKMDSHLYTDVNSPGLTTRIVQYNEVNRDEKLTMEPRYKGVGQLPIVNFNSSQPRQIPLKKSSVKIRIAPPDVSSYTPDHRMRMLTTEQHRPLLPSPVQESPGSPTKSVLEALKEISRKRIHSQDDTEYYSEDISKRQRKESLSRVAIGPNPFSRPPISKRPRDEEPREYMDSPLFSRHLTHDNGYKCWRPKKRQRNESLKCNDILSSLSSSRHLQKESSKRKAEMCPKEDIKQMKLTMQNVSHISISSNDTEQNNLDSPKSSENKTETQTTNNLTDFNKSKGIPKITLFNKVFPKEVNNTHHSISDDEDDHGHIKMPFVKPRKHSLNDSSGSLSYIERYKLSQMLSCLSDTKSVDDLQILPNTSSLLIKEADKANTFNTKTTTVTTESSIKPITVPKITDKSNTSDVDLTGKSCVTSTKTAGIDATTKISTIKPSVAGFISTSFSDVTSTNVGFSLANTMVSTSQTASPVKDTFAKPLTTSTIFGHTPPIYKSTGGIPALTSTASSISTTLGFNIKSVNNVNPSNATETISSPSTHSAPLAFGLPTVQTPSSSITAISKKQFSLGATTDTESSAAKDNNKGGFQFDLNKPILNETPKPSGNVIFGAAQINSSAENATVLNGPSFGNSSLVTQTGFTNSSSSTKPVLNSVITSSSIFGSANSSFGIATSNQNDSKLPSATTTANSFSLNSINATSTPPFVLGNSSSAFTSSKLSSVIAKPEISPTNVGNNPTLGIQTTTASSFGVQPAFNTASSLSMFGTNKTNAQSEDAKKLSTTGTTLSSTINFGASGNAPSLFGTTPATTTASGFAFATSNTNSKSLFPISTVSTNNTLFGASKATNTTVSTPNPNSNLTSTTTMNFGTGSSKPSVFGSSNSSIFGSTTSGPSMFGGPATTSSSATTSSIFGTADKAAFGATTASSFGATATATPAFGTSGPSSLPSFGSTNTSNRAFGAPTTTAPSFGAVASSTTPFGSNSASNLPAFQSNSTASAFGVVSPSASSSSNASNTFGVPNNYVGLGAAGSAPAFGAKTTFGTPSTTANIFGNSTQNTTSNPTGEKSVFTFGSNPTSSTPFNFGGQTTAANTFNFGSNANAPGFGANVTTPNFGTNAIAPSFSANASSFGANTNVPSFGVNATTPSFGTNTQLNSSFGASAPGGTFTSPSPAFGANPSSNMFSIGAGGSSKSRMRNRRQR